MLTLTHLTAVPQLLPLIRDWLDEAEQDDTLKPGMFSCCTALLEGLMSKESDAILKPHEKAMRNRLIKRLVEVKRQFYGE